MASKKGFFKYMIIIAILICITSVMDKERILNIHNLTQASLHQSLRTIKITEEKTKIEDKNISININMPEIHYSNSQVERYINTYIRKNINEYVNYQRQIGDLSDKEPKKNITINYHIAFEDKNLLNVIIYRNKNWKKNNFELEKDSYVFDLKTGQRIYIDNFLKDNDDYIKIIKGYIDSYLKDNKIEIKRNIININKDTNYIIVADGIIVYFNP